MRPLLVVSALFMLSGSVALADDDPYAGTFVATLPKEARETLAWLHKGMTRAEVEKKFEMDGGIYSPPTFRYYVHHVVVDSKVVMVMLTFQPAGMPDDVFKEEQLRNEWLRTHQEYTSWDSPKDILRNIGYAYLSGIAID